MMKRKICVVTGTRAEYGLLTPLMRAIQKDDELELQLVVTGMHLSPEFGLTFKQIEEDGFRIDEKVEMLISSDTPTAIVKSIGLATIGFAQTFNRLDPDIVVLLGDRFEIFAAAQTAMICRIPIAHIHGGELTEGLIDDPIRHSITKMSHIHFAATDEYRDRIIQMGEQPQNVHNVGALGFEVINNTLFLSKKELSRSLGFELEKYFLVTLHPTTLENNTAEGQIDLLLESLSEFKDYQFLFTKTNADTEGRIINERIERFVQNNQNRARLYESLGQIRYLSAIKHCDAVIGNSSSGLIEVPFFYKPTVNIGDRQRGRLKAESIIDCQFNKQEIFSSIELAISREFNEKIKSMKLLYGTGNTSEKIIKVLKNTQLTNIIKKKFNDIMR